jgi:hypothetical protein
VGEPVAVEAHPKTMAVEAPDAPRPKDLAGFQSARKQPTTISSMVKG